MLSPMTILSGNSNFKLAKAIADDLLTTIGNVKVDRFPDAETAISINQNIRGHEVYIIQPTCSTKSQSVNDSIMELLLIADAAKRASAHKIVAVIPYFGYARQDRKERSRAPISAKLVASLIECAGIDRVITLDLHANQIQGFFNIPVDHLYSSKFFINHIITSKWKPDIIISPDAGGVKMADYYSRQFNVLSGMIAKRRSDANTVEALHVNADVKGKHVLIVDDMTQSAGTLLQAAKIVKEQGALSVKAAVAHCLLSCTGVQRLKDDTYLDELLVTNSISQRNIKKLQVFDIAPLLARAINGVHTNTSISYLYK